MLTLLTRRNFPEAYENRPLGRLIRIGLRNELNVARHAFAPLPATRFVIFAQGRTGSTLLTSTLNSHPGIACADEILGVPRARPIRFVENAARRSGAACFGFHVKFYQLSSWQRVSNHAAWLARMRGRGWKILYLWRENALRHVVSNVFAEAAGGYHHWGPNADAGAGARAKAGARAEAGPTTEMGRATPSRPDSIVLPPERLRRGIAARRAGRALEQRALAGLDHLELCYERDLEDPGTQPETFRRIQDYLGVPYAPLTPSLRKAVVKPLPELIENYGEVRQMLLGTPEARFLDV